MKKTLILILLASTIFSCKTENKSDRNITLGDTITTDSGLKYIFLKKGNGQKIEEGSKVKIYTDLYLNDADTTIWKTSEDKDSVFAFIHKKTSLIDGFTEIHNYLVEGDEVIAILPDSLAYGEKGSGTVPPKATLVYNPLIVKYVSEPKKMMIDTLLSISKDKGVDSAVSFYEKYSSGKEYHSELMDIIEIFPKFTKDSMYIEMENFSKLLMSKADDKNVKQSLFYYQSISLDKQGKTQEAISIVEPLANQDLNKVFWVNTLKNLKGKLKK